MAAATLSALRRLPEIARAHSIATVPPARLRVLQTPRLRGLAVLVTLTSRGTYLSTQGYNQASVPALGPTLLGGKYTLSEQAILDHLDDRVSDRDVALLNAGGIARRNNDRVVAV